jgi:protein dithiol oxidoreductase (disulfide-forming)
MNSSRRTLLSAALALVPASLLRPQAASAQAGSYTELKPPLPVDANGKIEVVELFWYGCIHCYNLEPALENWLKKLPRDVEFRRIPAVFNRQMELDALIFYSFEALGVLPKMHKPFFDSIHRDRLRTNDKEALNEWLQKHDIDTKKFDDAMRSFGVQSKTRRAKQLTVDYKIDGTPAMGVNGHYTVSAGDGLLPTVDSLVERERRKK